MPETNFFRLRRLFRMFLPSYQTYVFKSAPGKVKLCLSPFSFRRMENAVTLVQVSVTLVLRFRLSLPLKIFFSFHFSETQVIYNLKYIAKAIAGSCFENRPAHCFCNYIFITAYIIHIF